MRLPFAPFLTQGYLDFLSSLSSVLLLSTMYSAWEQIHGSDGF